MKRTAATLMVAGVVLLMTGGTAVAYPPSDTEPPSTSVLPDRAAGGPTTSGPAASPTTTGPNTSGAAPVLPSTGSDSTMPAVVLGAGLIGSGALLTRAVRRRRTVTA